MKRQRSARPRGRGLAMFALGLLGGRLLAGVDGEDTADAPARHSRRIVHNAGEAIIAADETSRIVLANPAAASMFGVTVQQMEGSPLARFIAAPAAQRRQARSSISRPTAAPDGAAPITPAPACARMARPSRSKARSPTPCTTATPSTRSSCATFPIASACSAS